MEEASKALKRQRNLIFDLENHKLQLVRSLTVCRSKENTRKDKDNASKIAALAEEQVKTLRNRPNSAKIYPTIFQTGGHDLEHEGGEKCGQRFGR